MRRKKGCREEGAENSAGSLASPDANLYTAAARLTEKGHGRNRALSFERMLSGYSVQRLKTSEPLVPPKPKEFERA